MKSRIPTRTPDPNNYWNHVVDGIIEAVKTHSESREFRRQGNGLEFKTDLDFKETTKTEEFGHYQPRWEVSEGHLQVAPSLTARVMAKPYGRICGVDFSGFPATHRYEEETLTTSFWHENRPYYDRSGIRHDRHHPLDWPEELKPHQFAERTAELWNIETWREQPELELFEED